MSERIPELQSETVARDLESVEAKLRAGVRAEEALPRELADYLVASGGKRLRPMLMLLAFRGFRSAQGLKPRAELDDVHTLASVAEWVHTATLFHDDVLDASAERRGREAAQILHGNKTAILVGDFVYAEAFSLLMDRGLLFPSKSLATTMKTLVEGELLQHQLVLNRRFDLDVYDRIAKAKTASLFAWCTETGAWAAGLEDFGAAKIFGLELGFAFQMADDYFDTYGFDPKTGGDDALEEWCESAPPLAVCLAARESPRVAELWSTLLTRNEAGRREQVAELLKHLRQRPLIEACQVRIRTSLEAADRALAQLGGNASLTEAASLIRDRAQQGFEAALASIPSH